MNYFFLKRRKENNLQKGFTLMEGLVGVAVFIIIVLSVYQTYIKAMELVQASRLKIIASTLANEQFEIIRNMPYSDIGIVDGIPAGKIERERIINRDNIKFRVTATIRNIDDPFDGVVGGTPNDLSPADYKLVAFDIECFTCKNFPPVSFTTYIGPLALEMASTNGSLFVQVFDANGQPIQGADVHIENNQGTSSIIIDDTTNNDGFLQIVDTPTGTEAYEITVSKTGYSEEMTYPTGGGGNPNPEKPHATVVVQQLTQISFAIDKLSTLNINSMTKTCSSIGNIDFTIEGAKLIGTSPDIKKYSQNYITDGGGEKNIIDIEWDTYSITLTDATYDLVGAIPLVPLILNPDLTQDLKLIVGVKNPQSLLVTVKDASTQLPLSGVGIKLDDGGSYESGLITGRGFLEQTDWSGGSGQENFTDPTKYFDSDGNIKISDPAGELHLNKTLGEYETSGYLISSTFDTGSVSNFHQIIWQPLDQPPATGTSSVKFQIATNNDQASWDFLGPDGTSGTYYDFSDSNINAIHNGDQYFRYKAFMSTASTTVTSIISDVQFTFTSSCVPPGQIIFSGINFGSYNLTATKTDYQIYTNTTTVSSAWQQHEIILNPE